MTYTITMEDTYTLGPVSISKSFVKQPYFWPAVVFVLIVVIGLVFLQKGNLSSSGTPQPSIMAQVFPLNQQFGTPVLYASGTTIYRTDGHSEEKLFEVGSQVLSLVPSPDGSKLAATYTSPKGGTNAAGYPYTNLIFWDMNTRQSLPLIAENTTTVRYPQWSDDNRYISFWVNDGQESFIYDTARRKAIYSVKKDGSVPVSPIVFLPGATGITYIKNGTVYSAAIDGSRPISLAEQAVSVRTVDGTTVASAPMLSPNGTFLAYYAVNGDLMVVNTTTREVKTIGANLTALGFLHNEELLYGPKLSTFNLSTGQSAQVSGWQNFLGSAGSAALLKAAVVLPDKAQFYLGSVYPNLGPQFLGADGSVAQDCSKANFHYGYNNGSDDTRIPQRNEVVSPDGKYLLGSSDGALSVLDANTCQPYIFSQSKANVMTWAN